MSTARCRLIPSPPAVLLARVPVPLFEREEEERDSFGGSHTLRLCAPHSLPCFFFLCAKSRGGGGPPAAGPSHVVSHIYGVQLVGQEPVPQVHALLLPSGVDGDDAGVHHHHHAYDEVVLLQDHVGDQGHQVQGLLLRALKLHNHHQEVGPGEDRTGGRRRRRWRAEFLQCNQPGYSSQDFLRLNHVVTDIPEPKLASSRRRSASDLTCKQRATFTLQPKVVLTARGESPKSLKILEKDCVSAMRGLSSATTMHVRTQDRFTFRNWR
ncbi:hypothetical protein EYF80_035798 [Liparis tanakae]|uniref:Uncharacterized protein n=1 Tax=Liparis tanakae TaxID=230148 RepID=A0A4Z2GMF7_9TELE|nr:hypothetical protein EYF80_035798 [Liparis tanakae]